MRGSTAIILQTATCIQLSNSSVGSGPGGHIRTRLDPAAQEELLFVLLQLIRDMDALSIEGGKAPGKPDQPQAHVGLETETGTEASASVSSAAAIVVPL